MTDISTQTQSLTFITVKLTGLRKLAKTLRQSIQSTGPSEIDTAVSSDHTLRDIGADRRHERQHPSTMGRMF